MIDNSSDQPLFLFKNVCVDRYDRRILDNINLSMNEARIGIIGANGSGKSTFARLFNGLLLPTKGSVHIAGQDLVQSVKDIRKKVGFVFQNPDNQIVYPIVYEDIEFGLKGFKISKTERVNKRNDILQRFHLTHLKHRSVHSLSGGEKQMIALSCVLVMEPQIIILDEPTTLLDLKNKNRISTAIEHLEQNIVMVTHDLDLLTDFDRVIVFDDGRIVADDTPIDAISWYKQRVAGP